jgi:S1-C subfamily serine protease
MKLIKLLAAAGVLLVSFSITSFIMGSYIARHQEQNQSDFINETVGSNVVEIRDPEGKKGGGTGFFVKTPAGNNFILTNNHVCRLADAADVLLIDSEYYAQVVSHSPDHDLCLVSNPLNIEGINIAKNSRNGQEVFVVGHPLLEPLALIKGQISGSINIPILIGYNLPCDGKDEKKVDLSDNLFAALAGIESACIKNFDAQATTLNILPGNSGSPVVNQEGQVVGVAFAGREDGPGRGYIVPLSYIQKFLSDK